jgi:hypothetical protein
MDHVAMVARWALMGWRVRSNKFNAHRTTGSDGEVWHSDLERHRWPELQILQAAGKIRALERQKRLLVLEGYRDPWGVRWRPVNYTADFVYEEQGSGGGWHSVAEEWKGFSTPDSVIRLKLAVQRYSEIELMRAKDEWAGR